MLQPFQLLIKPVSAKCNAKCSYCFYNQIPKIFPEKPLEVMPDSVLENMVKKYLQLGIKENVFFWQGGEPTLAGLDFYYKAIEYQKQYGHNQSVGNAFQTNGILIDKNWAKLFSEYNFLVGISLDGPEYIHDEARGRGTHQKALNAIKVLSENHVDFNILTVLHRGNADKIVEIYEYLKTLPTNFFQFIPALDNNPITNQPMPYSITPKQYGDAMCELFDTWYPDDIKKYSIRTFDALINGVFGFPKGLCSCERECAPYIVIENQGDVYPCDFFVRPHERLGNILEHSFSDLIRNRQKRFGKEKSKVPKGCRACIWNDLCNGGCIKDRIYGENKNKNKTYFCESYRQLYTHTFHQFMKICMDLSKERGFRPIFYEKIDASKKCPCGSGKTFEDCYSKE